VQSLRLPGEVADDGRVDRGVEAGAADPAAVWLHPKQGVGAAYAALATVVLAIVMLTAASYLGRGWFLMSLVAMVGGSA